MRTYLNGLGRFQNCHERLSFDVSTGGSHFSPLPLLTANYVSKSSMRPVESTTSLAESTGNTVATNNTSEDPTSNPLPSFFQEEDDNSNPPASSNNSEVNFHPDILEVEKSEVQPPISPSTEGLSCSQDAIPFMDEEAKVAENESVKKADDLLKQAEDEDCQNAAESEDQKSTVGVKAEMDRAKQIYNMVSLS